MFWKKIKSMLIASEEETVGSSRPKRYTVTRKDGFGAQYQAIMSGVAYARLMNYQYIHTPFRQIDHGVDVAAMNRFIGIPPSRERAEIRENGGSALVNSAETPDIYYTDEVRALLRSWYNSTEKPAVDPDQIAIHIRRGDAARQNLTFRLTSNLFYQRLISDLRVLYPGLRIRIHSEGQPADFKELVADDVELALNEDLQVTFHSLVKAKVLVTAKSSLSYAAALLSENTIYYIPFWHKPLKSWIVREETD